MDARARANSYSFGKVCEGGWSHADCSLNQSGERLAITIRPPGKSGITLHPTLLAVRPERELRWLGHFIFTGIFDGEHYFLLDPLGDDRTRLTHGESFSGLLVGFLGTTLDATETGFNNMNAALKQQAELSLA